MTDAYEHFPDFDKYIKECDRICIARIGVGIHDMPDLMWSDFHEDGLSPMQAIDCALDEWQGDML